MRVEVMNRHFVIYWRYTDRSTVCVLTEVDDAGNRVVLGSSKVVAHPRDNYNRSIGRKLSLRELLAGRWAYINTINTPSTAVFDRQGRTAVWRQIIDSGVRMGFTPAKETV